jgi:hypothetical protein
MKYTVIWKHKALQRLEDIWSRASDRQAITEAADHIDAELRLRPFDIGESREDENRILTEGPLCITYRVRAADLCVDVWSVWLSKRV